MEIGIVGVGKMGSGIIKRLIKANHNVLATARSEESLNIAKAAGANAVPLDQLLKKLKTPRVVWLMIPAGQPVDDFLSEHIDEFKKGDIIIDGGNSKYTDTVRRSQQLAKSGLTFIDCGTSGGTAGEQVGYCLMVGGDATAVKKLQPIWNALAMKNAFFHAGPSGAGHFVKMVHNAVEYGMMQSIGEGIEMLERGPYKLDLAGASRVWANGSIIRGYLMDLAERALRDPEYLSIAPVADENGEGRWTVEAALQYKVPMTTLAHALFARFTTQRESTSMRVVAALRNQFGGHKTHKK